jgi:hypothetical protein
MRQAYETADGKPIVLLDDVDAGTRVATRAHEQHQRSAQHVALSQGLTLLGKLTIRRSSDSATGSAIRGHAR